MLASHAATLALLAPEVGSALPVGLAFFVLAALAWLFTYALHSTLLLSTAWLATRRLTDARAGLRERVWKFAVLGAFVTASVQVGLGFEPLGGRLPLQRAAAPLAGTDAIDEVSFANLAPTAPARGWSLSTSTALLWPMQLVGEALANLTEASSQVASLDLESDPELASAAFTLPQAWGPEAGEARSEPGSEPRAAWLAMLGGWTQWAFVSCVLGASAGLLLFALLWVRLNGRLRDRVALTHGSLYDMLQSLRERAKLRRPVRLSVAPSLGAPISMGMFRPEICVPPRVLLELSAEEQEVLLAHELAHVVRRDPLWLAICRLCEGVFFFQPLNRIARREIEDCAEFLSDAWAVRQTGLRYSLASCLTRIAEWIVGDRRALPAPAMAHGRSRLRHRVELLLDEEATEKLDQPPRWVAPACLGFTGALIACVPCVSATGEALGFNDDGRLPFLPVRQVENLLEAPQKDCDASDSEEACDSERDPLEELTEELDGLSAEIDLLRAEAGELHLSGRLAREIEQELSQLEMAHAKVRHQSARLRAMLQSASTQAQPTPNTFVHNPTAATTTTLFHPEEIPQ